MEGRRRDAPLDADATAPEATTTEPARRPVRRPTRTSRAWTGTVAAIVLLILLLIFILQNTASVKIHFLGANGHVPFGVALLVAAVAGGLIVGIVGAARIAQLKLRARRAERSARRTAAA
jgi:uncharacterized integral membrane protein